MTTKYELTNVWQQIELPDGGLVTVHRVRYLIGDFESGGWIETEHNLSQSGSCRVLGEAVVCGHARVSGGARVHERALIHGWARVRGAAVVSGDVEISGNADVYGNAVLWEHASVYGHARVFGRARVGGCARVLDQAIVRGATTIGGHATVRERARAAGVDSWDNVALTVGGNVDVCGCANLPAYGRFCGDLIIHGQMLPEGRVLTTIVQRDGVPTGSEQETDQDVGDDATYESNAARSGRVSRVPRKVMRPRGRREIKNVDE